MVAFVFCGSAGFGGSGHIMNTCMDALARAGHSVSYVGFNEPFHKWQGSDTPNRVELNLIPELETGAFGSDGVLGSSDALVSIVLANAVADCARKLRQSHSRVIVWAHYLFPFGFAAEHAAQMLSRVECPVEVWLTPAGSDIWQLAPQLSNPTEALLASENVSNILTYSVAFAAEVASYADRPIGLFTPAVPSRILAFEKDRSTCRMAMNLNEDGFTVSLHCNMRPVKQPEQVVMTVAAAAKQMGRTDWTLLLCGPEIHLPTLDWPLDVRQLGIVRDVSPVVASADVEINLSWHDSFNLSLAEAMALGVPVLSSDVVGVAADIASANAGVLVQSIRSPELPNQEAVDELCALATDARKRRVMGENARRWALEHFTISALIESLQAHLEVGGEGK